MMRGLRQALAVVMFVACSTKQLPLATANFAILPQHEAEAVIEQCSRAAPAIDGTWGITAVDVAVLEEDLQKLRRLKADACCFMGGRIQEPDTYFRQYVGVTVRGRRYIYINAFAAELLENWPSTVDVPRWRNVAFIGCDGGRAFWGALYDPATRKFSQLAINGSA